MIRSEDLARAPDDAWTLHEVTPDYRRYRINFDDGSYAQKTEYLGNDELIRANQEDFHDSIGRRWGEGKVVARVPLNILYSPKYQIAEKLREGDRDHMKWWLNSEQARPYRNWKGNI